MEEGKEVAIKLYVENQWHGRVEEKEFCASWRNCLFDYFYVSYSNLLNGKRGAHWLLVALDMGFAYSSYFIVANVFSHLIGTYFGSHWGFQNW